jgi:hypothetical protein
MLVRIKELSRSLKEFEKDMFDKWDNCHTCFVRLPLVTLAIVLVCVYFIK